MWGTERAETALKVGLEGMIGRGMEGRLSESWRIFGHRLYIPWQLDLENELHRRCSVERGNVDISSIPPFPAFQKSWGNQASGDSIRHSADVPDICVVMRLIAKLPYESTSIPGKRRC